MKNEAEFKSLFKKSVTRQKGFALSLAAPMIVGIPDLYVILNGFMPILLEAKFLGEIKREKFSRQVPFTAMQINWIQTCHDISPYSAMGLIGFIYKKEIHAALVAYGTPNFYNFSSSFLTDCAYCAKDGTTKLFDVHALFSKVPIPKIEHKQPQEASAYDTLIHESPLAL